MNLSELELDRELQPLILKNLIWPLKAHTNITELYTYKSDAINCNCIWWDI